MKTRIAADAEFVEVGQSVSPTLCSRCRKSTRYPPTEPYRICILQFQQDSKGQVDQAVVRRIAAWSIT